MIGLDDVLEGAVTSNKPTDVEFIYYLFWEKGIGWEEFKKLPIPYILTIVKTHGWIKKEEDKAHKKAMRKR